MIPVIFIVVAWWAASGAVASVKAARAASAERDRIRASANSNAAAGRTGNTRAKPFGTGADPEAPDTDTNRTRRLHPGDVTFGQWQASVYRRMRTRLRSRIAGQRHGKRVRDLLGDYTAASLAGATIFGMGFITGSVWVGARWSARSTTRKVWSEFNDWEKTRKASRSARPQSETDNNRPPLDENFTAPDGFNLGFEDTVHRDGWQPRPGWPFNPPPYSSFDDEPVDAELTDDIAAPAAPAANSRFTADEYADIVGQPELLAHYPDPTGPNGDPMEILTIHQLFDFSKAVITQATTTAEQDTIRANSASERAEQASSRSLTAGNRAEQAGLIAGDATSQATQMEETAARFSGLNMDSASLASMTTVIEAANAHAADKRRRAEAEANVAAIAAALAQAEEEAAAAAAASATSAMNLVEAAKGMHDTVQAHQMPHAEAQALTGNAAAHESVLAAN